VRLETALLGSRPLEANIEHFHRAILRYITMLCTLLLTALFSRPTPLHAAVNALQCSAMSTAMHTVLAMVFQRVEQMQSMAYLRRTKGIRNLRKRRTVASCYSGIATALEVVCNIVCAFGTYLIMIYWLKFGEMPGNAQYWWLAAASGASVLNGLLWGRARRFLPCFNTSDGTPRRYADVVFILVLCGTFYVVLFHVYKYLPQQPGKLRPDEMRSFTDPSGNTSVHKQCCRTHQSPGA
jgi:hypothetical protein